jgi:hypothetical protein
MAANCKIILKQGKDEFNDASIDIRVKPHSIEVTPGQQAITWEVTNNTTAEETIKLRAFRNIGNISGPHNPYIPITAKLKVTVPAGGKGSIVLDMDPASGAAAGDRFKYNIHVGKVLAVDPELEIV